SKVAQGRRTALVVAHHKQRRQNLDALPLFAIARIFRPTQHAVRRGKERDRSRTQEALRRDRKSILSQQSEPLAGRNSKEITRSEIDEKLFAPGHLRCPVEILATSRSIVVGNAQTSAT